MGAPSQALSSPIEHGDSRKITASLGLLVALYATARVMQAYPDRIPMLGIVAAHVLLPLFFALIH
jgi:hypothetical protein